jgi:hypothetical protein
MSRFRMPSGASTAIFRTLLVPTWFRVGQPHSRERSPASMAATRRVTASSGGDSPPRQGLHGAEHHGHPRWPGPAATSSQNWSAPRRTPRLPPQGRTGGSKQAISPRRWDRLDDGLCRLFPVPAHRGSGCRPHDDVMVDETFGPVMPIMPVAERQGPAAAPLSRPG